MQLKFIGILIFAVVAGLFFGLLLPRFFQRSEIVKVSSQVSKADNSADEKLKEEIGQMIMIGFRGTTVQENSEIQKIIKDVKPGGVSLSDFDVPSNSFPRNIVNPTQVKQLISDLQKISTTPLFIGVDAEGGNVNRLNQKYGFLLVTSEEKMGEDKTFQTVKDESEKLANELSGLGFNINLAPVVDVNINPKNPIIGALGRSFSDDPQMVTNQALEFIKSHLAENIITVAKHFPGQGSATTDDHLGITDVTNTYKQEELIPYQKLNDAGFLHVVMAGHITNKNVDSIYPSSLSANFLQNILRNQIGFKGVIISDDMQMAAIANNYKFDDAVVDAINAGDDIVYFFNNAPSGYDANIAYKARDVIFNAVKENKISREKINESYNRIINLKKQFKIIAVDNSSASAQILLRKFELLSTLAPINFNDALNFAKFAGGLTDVRPAFLMGILQEELKLEKSDLCYLTNFDTGEGIRISDDKVLQKVMNPKRDVPVFLKITNDLKIDPKKTPVTCPMTFGWGGAIGPADFLPSTWMFYNNKIEKITGKSPDPWNTQDAFLAAGLFLSDSGASLKTRDSEYKSAMIYFSGSPDSPYTWYATGAIDFADKIQLDIDTLKKN